MKKISLLQKALAVALLVTIASISAFAAYTALTPLVLVLNNAATVSAGALTVTMTACDTTNGNQWTYTGRDILLMQNTDTSAHSITVNPVVDQYGGTNSNLTTYSLPASSISAVQMKYFQGWTTSGGTITIAACSSNLIKLAVVQYN